MSEEATTSGEIGELAKALALAQGEIRAAEKDRENPFFNSAYATLASVWEACRAPLSKHNLSVVQQPINDGERVGVVTTLLHGSGQWMRSVLFAKPKDGTPQSLGSAITYVRRYALSAVAGVAPDDDDGNAAQGRSAGPKDERPPVARANTVKADGEKASAAAVRLLHTLRGRVGGLVVCDPKKPCPYENGKLCGYHTQLAAFKDSDGKPVRSSKDLSPEQISNLIERYERKIAGQQKRADQPVSLADAPGIGRGDPRSLDQMLVQSEMPALELCSYFGVDAVGDISPEDHADALALILHHGTDRFGTVLSKMRERQEAAAGDAG